MLSVSSANAHAECCEKLLQTHNLYINKPATLFLE